jgi:hypothetical protein
MKYTPPSDSPLPATAALPSGAKECRRLIARILLGPLAQGSNPSNRSSFVTESGTAEINTAALKQSGLLRSNP